MTAQLDDVRSGTGPAASPYRGLMPYTEADADYFFGREGEIVLIANNARANRFGVLYGPSGVGKSSVLRAGVVRHIRDENRRRQERYGDLETVVAYLKEWRDDPHAALAAEIGTAFRDADGTDVEIPADDLARATVRLCAEKDVDLVLVLDQFEEFSLYHRPEVTDFAEVIARLSAPSTSVNVLIAIREDALSWLDEFEGIVPDVFANTLRLDHLDEDSARSAITEPLRRRNAEVPDGERREIEPALVDALLHEVQAGRVKVDQLAESTADATVHHSQVDVRIEAPYLQLVLTRLWDEEDRRRSTLLRLSTLRELGGAQEIVRQHLDRVMRGFSPPEMAVLADAFGHLVTPSGSKIAHRPSDLAEFSGHDPAQVGALLRRLAEGDQRILRDVPPPLDEPHAEPRYEIFHDVLALAVLDWRRRFLAAAVSRRQQAELLAEKERVEQETRATRNRLRKARALIAGMALLLVLCVVAAALAVISRSSAHDAENKARANAREAVARKNEAEANKRLNDFSRKLNADPAGALQEAMGFDLDAEADPNGGFQEAFREAMDAADTDVVMRLGAPVLYAGFAGDDSVVAVTEDGHVRVWDVASTDPVRLVEDVRLDVQVTAEASTRILQAVPADSGGFVVVLTDDHQVSSVDLETGNVQPLDRTFGGGATLVVADSGTRQKVLVWDFERHLVVWDVAHNKVVRPPRPDDRLDFGAIDPSGQRLAVVSGLRVDVFDLGTRRPIASRVFDTHLAPDFRQVAQTAQAVFTGQPDTLLVIIGGHKVEASLWQYREDHELPLGVNLFWKSIYDVANLNLGGVPYLAVAGDKTVILFDQQGRFQAQTASANDWITQLEVSPVDSSVWAVGAAEGYSAVYRTNLYPPQPSWTFRGQSGMVRSLTFSADGQNLVSGSVDGSVRVWRMPDERLEWYIPDWVGRLAYTPDGAYTLGATPSGSVVRQDSEEQLVSKFANLFGQAFDMAAAPDGTRAVLTEQYCTTPVELTMDDQTPLVTFAAPDQPACATVVAWNPDDARHQLVAGTFQDQLVAWDTDTGKVTGSVDLGDETSEVHSVAISGDGKTVAAGTGSGVSGEIHVLRADDLSEVTSWATSDVDSLALSVDGTYVVAAGNDHHVVDVWDAATGELEHSMTQATGSLGEVTVSPDADASRVAVTTSAGIVYVWARESGQLLAQMRRHADAANEAVFDPRDIDQMQSGGDDGFVMSYTCAVCALGADELKAAAQDRLAQEIDLGD